MTNELNLRSIAQGSGEGVTATATAGGSVSVEPGTNDTSVTVTNAANGDVSKHNVSPGKTTTIPIPNVPAGTTLVIQIGKGRNARIIAVEVIEPGP
jgi:isocitrate dehydrogenase